MLAGPVRTAGISAATLLVVLTLCAFLGIRLLYDREMRESQHEIASFNDLLARQTAELFRNVALVQDGVLDDLRAAELNRPGRLQVSASGRDTYERLRQRVTGTPQLDALSLIDTGGHLVNFSRGWPIPALSISDRDYFQALKGDTPLTSFIGQPVRNRGSGDWTIYLARRISGPSNEFAGLVLGAMRLDYFEGLYRDLNIPAGSSIGLWRRDGLLLAHYPPTSQVGQSHPLAGIETLRPGRSHVAVTARTFDGQERMIASSQLADLPIVVTYAQTMHAVLSTWRLETSLISAATLFCAIGVVILATLVARQFQAYEAAATAQMARETAERVLHDAEAKLLQGQKLEAIGRLTSGIAHDFNNLLTVVRANAELLLATAIDAKAMRRIAVICQAADRGAALTRQMAAFSRQQVLSPHSIDLNHILQNISALLCSGKAPNVELRMELSTDLHLAYADASQLEQAIVNLVMNAQDAVEGGGVILIETTNASVASDQVSSHLPPGDYVSVTVADTGIGMTLEVMSRAFDPFFTTKRQGEGTGLGLSQVIGFARQSNGDVLLESASGAGTRVTILLPRASLLEARGATADRDVVMAS